MNVPATPAARFVATEENAAKLPSALSAGLDELALPGAPLSPLARLATTSGAAGAPRSRMTTWRRLGSGADESSSS